MVGGFETSPIAGAPFGLEVTLDPRKVLTEAEKDTLVELYRRDGLLLVRGGELSADEQITFCRNFGPVPLDQHDVYFVSNAREDGILTDLELLFHHDIPYVPAPFLAGCLHAIEVTPGVSATRYANGFAAYERLPQKLRERIADMKAVFVRPRVEDRRCRLTDSWSGDNCAVHAIVQRQEGTGRPYIFANAHSTALICGLAESDSNALLEELASYLYAPGNVYAHEWTNGDTVIWDNLAHQHARAKVTSGVRTLRRASVTVLAYDQQYPADSAWFADLQEGRMNAKDMQTV
jgi:alpha-ketoglutarate-dependent taurine dioxygenase